MQDLEWEMEWKVSSKIRCKICYRLVNKRAGDFICLVVSEVALNKVKG